MTVSLTEALHDSAEGLDERPLAEVAALLAEGQVASATALLGALDSIVGGAGAMARTIRADGVLHYAAAGSSGLMAAADAVELGGTFSIPAGQIRIHMAGGLPVGVEMPGATEDDATSVQHAMSGISSRDTVIAVSASGTTPYTLAAAEAAQRRGATLIAIANNSGAALLVGADHPVCLATPPEVLSGSTRMGAGTAQKIALNMSGISSRDTVIAVSASGTTPYTLAAAEAAQRRGATLIAIANNSGAALLVGADHPVCLATPPEVLSGSTRMGAGTAQKIALNMLSTLMAIELGHVHDGMMVNLRADNVKLRARATGIVGQIAGKDRATASMALKQTHGFIKSAILVAAKDVSPDEANAILQQTDGNLRAALAQLK
ncbi:MAG: N-acetylmuramic acid 6-phosphate etherase [Boseongicola sp.]|nr:N-acetylmuramic acid 6-phosphate etherase [Boseongicola sp.]